jgi:hypothetical protein
MQGRPTHKGLAEQIRRLEKSRQKHAAALAEIDQLLHQIGEALRSSASSSQSIPDAKALELTLARPAAAMHAHGRRYRKLALTGEKAIVAFVQRRGRASTSEINEHWRAEGRGGVANNAIVRLMKRGALVREPIPNNRGSWYRYGGESPHSDVQSQDFSRSAGSPSELSASVAAGPVDFTAEPVGTSAQGSTFG